jgi:hypothetical protein
VHNFGGAVEQLQPLAALGDRSPATVTSMGLAALELPFLPTAIPRDKQDLVQAAGRAVLALYAHRDAEAEALFTQLLSRYPKKPGVHYVYALLC